ncbi:T9SS type A sorting domain-containing protein [Bacteroidota bacterium]
MKTLICLSKLIFLTSILVTALQAQIPNPGFEDWTGGEPNGWYTGNFPPLIVNVTQTNISHTGNWAAKGEVIDVMTIPIPPLLGTGSLTSPGFPVNQRFNRIKGYYQFSPVGGDHFLVVAQMSLVTTSDTVIIGTGGISIGDAVSQYESFEFYIDYYLDSIPNWANIAITITDPSGTTPGHIGSTMLVDDFDFVVNVDDSGGDLIVKEFMLRQNYPNPFNPSTTIKYQIPELSFVTLKVYDVLGNEIATLVNEEKVIGSYEIEFSAIGGSASGGNAYTLPSGVYFYRLQVYAPGRAGSFVETKKMILLR